MIGVIIRIAAAAIRIVPATAIVGFLGYLGVKKLTEKDEDK